FTAPSAALIFVLSLHDALPIFSVDPSLGVSVTGSIHILLSSNNSGRPRLSVEPTSFKFRICVIELFFREGIFERCFGILLVSVRSEEHTSELQSRFDLVCRLLL